MITATRARESTATRWRAAVQYRWTCAVCGETHMVAVIRLRDGRTLRLCGLCFDDGHWR